MDTYQLNWKNKEIEAASKTNLRVAAQNGHLQGVLEHSKKMQRDGEWYDCAEPVLACCWAAGNFHADIVEALGNQKLIGPSTATRALERYVRYQSANGNCLKTIDELLRLGGRLPEEIKDSVAKEFDWNPKNRIEVTVLEENAPLWAKANWGHSKSSLKIGSYLAKKEVGLDEFPMLKEAVFP